MINLIRAFFAVLAVVLFVIAGFDFWGQQTDWISWGLASLAAAHIPFETFDERRGRRV